MNMNKEQGSASEHLDPEAVRALFDAPPTITQIENFKFITDPLVRDELTALFCDPTNASLDVSDRLIVGRHLDGGAQGDVYEG